MNNAPKAAAFGYVNGLPLFLDTEKHVLIMASNRSGKGAALIIPHLLRYPGSTFNLDPKGENAYTTHRQRRRLNDKVHVLDPFRISGIKNLEPARFNPIKRFTPENMDAESKALASALVVAKDKNEHFTAAGEELIAAHILYVAASPDIPPEMKDLLTVRRHLVGSNEKVLEEMTETDIEDGRLADLAQSFLEIPEKEFGSVVSSALRQTQILDNPMIAATLRATGDGEEVDFSYWHEGTMSVFLCLAAPKFPVFNRWLRLVLAAALDEMTERLDPPPLPVCFILDELATLGHMEVVENAVGLAAGYGVQLWNVFQDAAQMRDLYRERWASFIGNAGIRAVFNLDDYDTADYWSKFLGHRLVATQSQAVDNFGLTSGGTVSETQRRLQAPEEIMRNYAWEKMLILVQGVAPIEALRVPYYRDESLKGLWDDPRQREPMRKPVAIPLQPRVETGISWDKVALESA